MGRINKIKKITKRVIEETDLKDLMVDILNEDNNINDDEIKDKRQMLFDDIDEAELKNKIEKIIKKHEHDDYLELGKVMDELLQVIDPSRAELQPVPTPMLKKMREVKKNIIMYAKFSDEEYSINGLVNDIIEILKSNEEGEMEEDTKISVSPEDMEDPDVQSGIEDFSDRAGDDVEVEVKNEAKDVMKKFEENYSIPVNEDELMNAVIKEEKPKMTKGELINLLNKKS